MINNDCIPYVMYGTPNDEILEIEHWFETNFSNVRIIKTRIFHDSNQVDEYLYHLNNSWIFYRSQLLTHNHSQHKISFNCSEEFWMGLKANLDNNWVCTNFDVECTVRHLVKKYYNLTLPDGYPKRIMKPHHLDVINQSLIEINRDDKLENYLIRPT